MLHLDSSANRSEESLTRQLSRLFADTWQSVHGAAGYRYRDLSADPISPIDTAYCQLGRRSEQYGVLPPDKVDALVECQAEETAWALTRPLIAELVASGTVVIGAPMYNYSLPASLKAWIDRISFPGAFVDPETGTSLLANTKVVVISSRGGAYGPGTPRDGWDYELPYLRAYFTNHGVLDRNIRFITAELALADLVPHLAHLRPHARASLAAARTEVRAAASGGLALSGVAAGQDAGAGNEAESGPAD